MDKDKDAAKEYEEMGIEFEEAPIQESGDESENESESSESEQESEDESEEEDSEDNSEGESEDKSEDDKQPEPQPLRKRSIYQDLKDKKAEVKTERELREQAERERDELKKQLEEKGAKKVDEDIEAYAEEIGADPEALQRMRDVLLKGVNPAQPVIPKEFAENMEAFREWQSQQETVNEEALFNNEFQQVVPTIKKLFPSVSEENLNKMKAKVDELAHTPKYHDKDLDYVIFKEQETLKPFVTPKKVGIEGKRRADAHEVSDIQFDPNADISKMTPKESEEWEKNYQKMSATPEGLMTDGRGKKIII